MAGTLWIDVEDLINYTRVFGRPSGIQRVAFEISRALHASCGTTGAVRFVRHDPIRNSFRTAEWSEIARLINELNETEPPREKGAPERTAPYPPARLFVQKLVYRLPELPRIHLVEALVAQERALRAWARLFASLARGIVHAPGRLARRRDRLKARAAASQRSDQPAEVAFRDQVAPGDTLLTLGAPWSHPDYVALIEKHRTRLSLRYALLVYDIIPLRRPEWCDHGLVRGFRAFFDAVLPMCDNLLAISHATAADVAAYARERGIRLAAPIVPIPMGSSFGAARSLIAAAMVPRTGQLPPAGNYVLFVSTIEARKNHLLMFRVWRRLLEELPSAIVPSLVFAGRIGWLVDDLMRQIASSDYLDGRLIVVETPNDAELVALYQGCQFTVFPSLYEGWGLPVTESLAFGKPCLIADRTSLPEAGGDLARRFDPDNLNDAFAAIRNVILDPKGLARWEEQVRREFRPVSWTASAEALLAALGLAVTAETGVTRNIRSGMVPAEPGTIPGSTAEAMTEAGEAKRRATIPSRVGQQPSSQLPSSQLPSSQLPSSA